MTEYLKNPGSLRSFTETNPHIPEPEVAKEYGEALSVHRTALAEALGVSLQDLHDMNFDRQKAQEILTNK